MTTLQLVTLRYFILVLLIVLPTNIAIAIDGVINNVLIGNSIDIQVDSKLVTYELVGISTLTDTHTSIQNGKSVCYLNGIANVIANYNSIVYFMTMSSYSTNIKFNIVGTAETGVSLIYSKNLILDLLSTGNAYITHIDKIPPEDVISDTAAEWVAMHNKIGIWNKARCKRL